MLNILIETFLENEHDEEPVIVRDEGRFSGEGLTDDEWENPFLFEESIGSMPTATAHVSPTQFFCTGKGSLDTSSASN